MKTKNKNEFVWRLQWYNVQISKFSGCLYTFFFFFHRNFYFFHRDFCFSIFDFFQLLQRLRRHSISSFRLFSFHIETRECRIFTAFHCFDRFFSVCFSHQRHDIHCSQIRSNSWSAKIAEKFNIIVVIMKTAETDRDLIREDREKKEDEKINCHSFLRSSGFKVSRIQTQR